MKANSWSENYKQGALAVQTVAQVLIKDGHDVTPVMARPGQRRGDLYVSDMGYVEVKGDFSGHNSLFLETEVSGKPGWVFASRADWLAYYLHHSGEIYLIRMADLLRFLTEHYVILRQRTRTTLSRRGRQTWTSRGIPVSLDELDGTVSNVLKKEDEDDC